MSARTTDLVYAGASLRDRQDYALALSKAGDLIPKGLRDANGHPNPGKILLVTEYGNALGIHPIVAINGIDIIEGNLTITPALMSGLVREKGHKLRITTKGAGAGLTATAVLVRTDDPGHPFEVTWTMVDAKAAGLDQKQNWKKYPRAMLKARAISEVCREGAEDVLMGAYTPEELGAAVNESGEIIEDAEVVDVDEAPLPAAPSTKPRSATSWVSQIQECLDFNALTELRQMASEANALELRDRGGHTVDQWFHRRRAELDGASVAQDAPDGDEYDEDLETPF